jgi:hypothetical protein
LNAALETPIRHAFGTQSEEALQRQQVELRLQQILVPREILGILRAAVFVVDHVRAAIRGNVDAVDASADFHVRAQL